MSTQPLSLELIPIESGSEVTPAVEPIDASGQAAPELTFELPTPAGLALEDPPAPAPENANMPDMEIDVAPIAAPMTDRHMIAATTEFEKGEIDQPLWDRAFAQAKGDRKAAIATYLPARATALRVLNRDKPPAPRPTRPAPSSTAGPSTRPLASRRRDDDDEPLPGDFRLARYKSYGIKAAVTLCAGIVVLVFVTYVYPGGDSSSPAFASSATPSARAKSALDDAKEASKAKAAAEAAATARAASLQKLVGKVEEFRATDNWNLLVLYATEWTRQEPGNAVAWSQLSQGFERLRQFSEAREAATTAVKLAPKEPRYWRNLGDLDIELNRPEDALKSFEVATGLDDKDVHSVVQMGVLNVALSRLAEAKVASSRALELSPDDPGALCLRSLIASSLAPPKAPTSAARKSVTDTGCRNTDTPSTSPVIANNAAETKATTVPLKR